MLEDHLWEVAKTQFKVLPSIGANTFFLHRQRQSINETYTATPQHIQKRHSTLLASEDRPNPLLSQSMM